MGRGPGGKGLLQGKSCQVAMPDDSEYTDPIDGSVTKKQVSIVVTVTIERVGGGLRGMEGREGRGN